MGESEKFGRHGVTPKTRSPNWRRRFSNSGRSSTGKTMVFTEMERSSRPGIAPSISWKKRGSMSRLTRRS